MVAYSFAPEFRNQVSALIKLQTIRPHRKRHARPGEKMQLYTAMRTMHCRKLVDPDPNCVSVEPIVIQVTRQIEDFIASIEISGRVLHRDEIEPFAVADGFSPSLWGVLTHHSDGAKVRPATARYWMGRFWLAKHGEGRFDGVLIKWRPRA